MVTENTGSIKKGQDRSPARIENELERALLGHLDAGELETVTVDRALHSDVMTGVSGDLVLSVDVVDLVVGVVDEHVARALFLDALGGTSGVLLVGPLRATVTVGNITRHRAVRGKSEHRHAKRKRQTSCEFDFHGSPS